MNRLTIPLLLTGLFITQNVLSHPHHSPLTFIKHKRDGGGNIITNVPKKCFKDGRLICHDYYFLKQAGPAVAPATNTQPSSNVKP